MLSTSCEKFLENKSSYRTCQLVVVSLLGILSTCSEKLFESSYRTFEQLLEMLSTSCEKLFESSYRTFEQLLEMLSTSCEKLLSCTREPLYNLFVTTRYLVTKYLRNFLNVDNKLLTHTRENLCTTCLSLLGILSRSSSQVLKKFFTSCLSLMRKLFESSSRTFLQVVKMLSTCHSINFMSCTRVTTRYLVNY